MNSVKPPLGIVRKRFWIEQRIGDLFTAATKYIEHSQPDFRLAKSWVLEAHELICQLEDMHHEVLNGDRSE